MKTLMGLTAALAAGSSATMGAESVKFYGGDYDGANQLLSSCYLGGTNGFVYDDFAWDGGCTMTSVFGNYFTFDAGADITAVNIEIRSGASDGDGGTIVHRLTTSDYTVTDTGQDDSGRDLVTVDIELVGLSLSSGNYYLGIQVKSASTEWYIATASGTNGVGSPLNNGNSLFDAPDLGYDFDNVTYGDWDFSYGARGEMIPLPSASALAGLGLLGIGTRRRRGSL